MRRQKNRARVADAFQAALGHREDADLVDRAEAVLDRAHEAKARMRVAFEIEHRIDDVLQHTRPGERAFLGHMADEHDGDAARLGGARQVRRALAHLRHRARRGRERIGVQRLDRIDDAERRRFDIERGEDALELNLRHHAHTRAVEAEPLRTQRHLRAALFAADVEHLHLLGQRVGGLQQQRALADARVAADQRHAAGHDAAAEHAVQLFLSGGRARDIGGIDVGQRRHRRALGQRLKAVLLAAAARLTGGFFERVPGAAMWALAEPLRIAAAALVADEDRLFFGHAAIVTADLQRGFVAVASATAR